MTNIVSTAEFFIDERRLIRRVDWRLLPILGVLYSICLIDRVNLGIATRLDIGARYTIVTAVFFVPELPGNIIVRKVGASNWLAFCAVSWGIAQLAMGFVPSWQYLALCRALLGAFEAGFFPAMVYIVTTWYKRHEVQKRLGGFYLLATFISAFSPIFGYLFTLVGGTHRLSGWRYIFIIEGAITIGCGLIGWTFIPDFPDATRTTFLNEAEVAFILQRIEDDRGDAIPDAVTLRKVFHHLCDWTVWAYGMCTTMAALSIGYFSTLILQGMGWSVTTSLLLVRLPFIASNTSMIWLFSWLSDKYQQRAIFIALGAVVTAIGTCFTAFLSNNTVRYLGIFLTCGGANAIIPGVLAYASNNVVSQSKRAVTTATTIMFGGIGGIFSAVVFRQQDAPSYRPGSIATLTCQLSLLALLALTTGHFRRRNAETRRGNLSSRSLEEKPGFMYTL
ncbi:MFS general substrate transporter [Fistulina hepatica ATCC 64428]|uniref:MFS general substrate transporter n=1 Tax=Fistulina hepatica ATCC 64428 TaxID=1128425 RepID=A0A0D7A194_9AGAR|nr:MFS general substrate transporter [Fistulina hepatica ATCC 64428]